MGLQEQSCSDVLDVPWESGGYCFSGSVIFSGEEFNEISSKGGGLQLSSVIINKTFGLFLYLPEKKGILAAWIAHLYSCRLVSFLVTLLLCSSFLGFCLIYLTGMVFGLVFQVDGEATKFSTSSSIRLKLSVNLLRQQGWSMVVTADSSFSTGFWMVVGLVWWVVIWKDRYVWERRTVCQHLVNCVAIEVCTVGASTCCGKPVESMRRKLY